MSANFSDLQSVNTASGTDQMMLRLDNGATGPDGFARIKISDLNSVFTSNLTASDAKVKQMSANWDASYSLVNANSSVFTLTVDNSANWNAAYSAITGDNFNFGNKQFDYVTVNGPYDASGIPIFKVDREPTTTGDMVQVIHDTTSSMFRITTAGSVGIFVNENFEFAPGEVLYVNGNQRIFSTDGNALTVDGNMVVNGSLSALSATYISTIITTTSAISISSNGPGPALFVNQFDVGSTQNIAQFKSNAATITVAGDGDITGFNDLSGSGRVVVGNSNAAANATSYVLGSNNNDNNLANVIILGSNISAPVANYTYVQNLSTAGTIAANSFTTGGRTSSDWNSTYTTVNAQSAANASVYSSFNAQSAANASVYSSFNAQSAANASVYSTTNSNSATWSALSTAFNVVSATNTSALTATGSNTNINAALVAKGTGATVAQIPTNTSTGGNARGTYATDWQKARSINTQVASGNYSVVGGGTDNIASGIASTVAGGAVNTASGGWTAIAGGFENTASGTSAAIGGGEYNIASGNYAAVAGGINNTASGQYSLVGSGSGNNASGQYAFIGGGDNNIASAQNAAIVGGTGNKVIKYGGVAAGAYNTSDGLYSTTLGIGASSKYIGEFAVGGGYVTNGGTPSQTAPTRHVLIPFNYTSFTAGSASMLGQESGGGIVLPPRTAFAFTATILGVSAFWPGDATGLHYIINGLAKCNSSNQVTVYRTSNPHAQKLPLSMNAGISASGNKLHIMIQSPSTAVIDWTAKLEGIIYTTDYL